MFIPSITPSQSFDYYYTRDHEGSVREIVDGSGNIVTRLAYDSYGRMTVVTGTNLPTKQYTGDYYHAASGLNLTLYRAYDSTTGRWLSRDPIAENGGIDLYDYVLNNPIEFIDNYGLAIYVCVRPAPIGGGDLTHAYFWDSTTGHSCGRDELLGGGTVGDNNGAGPSKDTCVKVPGSDGKESAVMDCCHKNANHGFFVPFLNDCHVAVKNCLSSNGLPNQGIPYFVPYPGGSPSSPPTNIPHGRHF